MLKTLVGYLELLIYATVLYYVVNFMSVNIGFFIANGLFETEIKTLEYLILLCKSLCLCLLLLCLIYNWYQYCGIFAYYLVLVATSNIGLILGHHNILLLHFFYGFGLVFICLWCCYPHHLFDFVFSLVLWILIVNIYWYFF